MLNRGVNGVDRLEDFGWNEALSGHGGTIVVANAALRNLNMLEAAHHVIHHLLHDQHVVEAHVVVVIHVHFSSVLLLKFRVEKCLLMRFDLFAL